MVTPEHEIELALEKVDPAWDATDTEHGLSMLRTRLRRRAISRRVAAGLSAAAACVAIGWGAKTYRSEPAPAKLVAASTSASAIRFSDGSTVTRLGSDTLVSVVEASAERIVTAVDRGHVDVDVAPRPTRRFQVRAGDVVVEALGTAFTVERQDERVGVAVRHGRVRVTWMRGTSELGQGESSWFPPAAEAHLQAAPELEPATPRGAADAPRTSSSSGTASTAANPAAPTLRGPSWKALALDGRHHEAYSLLREHRKSMRDPEDLLLAADVARLSGHPADAVPYLDRLLKESPSHPSTAMAAFALGRIFMTSLGSPEKAAHHFADARRRANGGSLAEDALAREVEAWALAGAHDRARERASEYLRLYPRGQRSRAVTKFGGLE